jgi:thiamine biosynthesis lipoprotein
MRLAMGSFVTVHASATSKDRVEVAIESAFATVAQLEGSLHPHRIGSDIAAINAVRLGTLVKAAASTMQVLKIAAEVFAASDGVFDPCLPTHSGTFATIELREDSAIVRKEVCLDLGGIAKGFAVDEALTALRKHGCLDGSVNIGGDVAAFGARELIGLRRADDSLVQFELENAAVAVTNVNAVSQPAEHRGYYKRAASRSRIRDYAAVFAPSAAIADALTKCALYCDDDELHVLLNRFDARLI